ncbi:MAG: hypothetical protein QM640_12025, partial [Niabella sp.]
YAMGPLYESVNSATEYVFYPYRENEDASDSGSITQYLSTTGIKPNFGATVRWRSIGLSADYSPGNVKMIYTTVNNGVETSGH